jgi:hypothetical protein
VEEEKEEPKGKGPINRMAAGVKWHDKEMEDFDPSEFPGFVWGVVFAIMTCCVVSATVFSALRRAVF